MKLSLKYKIAIFLIDLISKSWKIKANKFELDSAIVAFWHGKMLPVWKYFSNRGAYGVVSLSKDGEILSHLLKKWGYNLIRGSSSRGGKEVLDEIVEKSKNSIVLITPDGPRGPAKVFKAGAVIASIRSRKKLVLCGVKIKWKLQFKKSWDSFSFPLPFSRIQLVFSTPLQFDKDSSKEQIDEYINLSNLLLNELDA